MWEEIAAEAGAPVSALGSRQVARLMMMIFIPPYINRDTFTRTIRSIVSESPNSSRPRRRKDGSRQDVVDSFSKLRTYVKLRGS